MRSILSLLGILGLLVAAPRPAIGGTEVTYDLGLYSAYVWRGITYTDGAVLQPAITTSHDSGFSLNVWGNLDLDDANDLSGEFQEVDITLAYAFGGDTLTAEIGLIEYLYPSEVGPSSTEVYLAVGLDTAVSPTVTLYYDFDQVDDYYGSLGLEWAPELAGAWSATVAALVGFAGEDFAATAGGVDSGLFDGELRVSLAYARGRWSLGGLLAYTDSLDTDVLPDQPVDLYGAMIVSATF